MQRFGSQLVIQTCLLALCCLLSGMAHAQQCTTCCGHGVAVCAPAPVMPTQSCCDSLGCDDAPSCGSQILACNCCGCRSKYANLTKLPLDRYKKSFFQLSETEAAWIRPNDGLGVTEINSFLRVAIPLDGTTDNVIALQPGLRTYLLDGPTVVDVPETLYDAQLSIVWRKKHSERWQTNVWLQPKIRSDFESSEDNFFFSGGAYARYAWKPNVFDLYLGAFYLDRDDISVLPAVGFIWSPTPDWRIEALLPRPKIAHRLVRIGDCYEKWAYLSGQLGGGSFAVERDAGFTDKVTLRDLRIFLGIESVRPGGAGMFAEVGYVFNRGIEYKRFEEEYEFDGSLMLRVGMRL